MELFPSLSGPILTIWLLLSSSSRETESIYSPLKSGVALSVPLANRMQQKKCASCERRLKRSWYFSSLSWKSVQPRYVSISWAAGEGETRWSKPTIATEVILKCCYKPTCQLITDAWVNPMDSRRKAQLNPAHVTKLSDTNDCCSSYRV